MKTIKDVFDTYKQALLTLYNSVNEVEAITLAALTETTGLSRAKLKAFTDTGLTAAQEQKMNDILTRLQTAEPVQYILGHTEFYGLPFKVNPSVLIPRPETEELVQWVLAEVKDQRSKVKILDIGTGSGCIAISLKKNLPEAEVSAIDFSAAALKTAHDNAELNNVEINFSEADILNITLNAQHVKHNTQLTACNIIISNPPYVTPGDKARMHENVTRFEPHSALFVPGNDPLIFYKAIADFSLKNLMPGGLLFFEINESFGPETVELLAEKGFKNIELRQDMSGRDRMVKASRS